MGKYSFYSRDDQGKKIKNPALTILISLFLLSIIPSFSFGGMGGNPPIINGVYSNPARVAPGGNVNLMVLATPGSGALTRIVWTAPAGTFPNGTSSQEIADPSQNTIQWTAPAAEGEWDIQVGVYGVGTFGDLSAKSTIRVKATTGNLGPQIPPLVIDPEPVMCGRLSAITSQASDPEGDPLFYAWTVSAGVISGQGDSDPWAITWTPPSNPGRFVIELSVSDGNPEPSTAAYLIEVVYAEPSGNFTDNLISPVRLTTDLAGNVYVTDSRQKALLVYTPWGDFHKKILGFGDPVGVAVSNSGVVYIGDVSNGSVVVLAADGTIMGRLGSGAGEFVFPTDVEVDASSGDIYVADGKAAVVKVYGSDLAIKTTIPVTGSPADIVVRSASNRLYVADARSSSVKIYDLAGTLLSTIGALGQNSGEFVRIQGMDIDGSGNLYIVDVFQGNVSVFNPDGSFIANIGSYGTEPGQLITPKDVAIDPFGRALVASGGTGRIEIFNPLWATGPSCAGDTDCDGMPDAWEISNKLNPNNPGDAFLDNDNDGLANIDEYLNNTNPSRQDTDGDGVSDFDEINSGTDPLDPSDNLPDAIILENNMTTIPALIEIDGRNSNDPNGDPLTYKWELVSGPGARFFEDASPTARVLVRQAGVYEFSLTVNDGKTDSQPAIATVHVLDVEAVANAGPDEYHGVGEAVKLLGSISVDTNGENISCRWRQVAGPAASLADWDKCIATLTADKPGVVTMELTVWSGKLEGTSDAINIIFQSLEETVPRANAGRDFEGTAGENITLDGSGSVDSQGSPLTYSWTQILGPATSLDLTDPVKPKFTPSETGVYVFSLQVKDGTNTSLPDEVTVTVHPVNKWLPYAEAGFDNTFEIGQFAVLDGSRSLDLDGDPLVYRWSQISGPIVDLRKADTANPSFGPPQPGVYVFELHVSDSDGTGKADRVSITVNDGADHVHVYRGASSGATSGNLATLPEPFHTDILGGPLNTDYYLMQLSGPPVANWSQPAFLYPSSAGIYIFKTTVTDGKYLSKPVLINLSVFSGTEGPPLADAGVDQIVIAEHETILSGSGSIDPQNDPLIYHWSQVSGPVTLISHPNSMSTSIYPSESGRSYTYSLEVSDPAITSLPDEVVINAVDVPGAIQQANADGSISMNVAVLPETLLENVDLAAPAGALDPETIVAIGLVWDVPSIPGYRTPAGMLFIGPEATKLNAPATLSVTVQGQMKGRLNTGEISFLMQNPWTGQWEVLPTIPTTTGFQTTITALGRIALSLPDGALIAGVGPAGGGGRNSNGWCFIATAAYGEYDAPRVQLLREFRDEFLVTSRFGRRFIHGYYRISPPIARAVSNYKTVRYLVRVSLVPLAAISWFVVRAGFAEQVLVLMSIVLLLCLVMKFRSGKVHIGGKGKVLKFIIIFSIVLLPCIIMALDPPHDTGNSIECNSCHISHRAPGMTLTNVNGNVNLCLSCHTPGDPVGGGRALEFADQAVPGVGGTSHRWDAAVTNPTYQTTSPASAAMSTRLDSGKLMCSTCHNQHLHDDRLDNDADTVLDTLVTRAPFDPNSPTAPALPATQSPAGRHFMRITNSANEMCLDCHATRRMGLAQVRTYNAGVAKSHPVEVAYPSIGNFHNPPLEPNGNPQAGPQFNLNGTGDTNLSNNYMVDINGNVVCLSCHGVHNADSNEATDDMTW